MTARPIFSTVAVMLLSAALLALGVLGGLQIDAALSRQLHAEPVAPRPNIYLVSLTMASYPDEDVWLVSYTLDGHVETVPLPIQRDPEEFLAHLSRIGTLEGREK